MTPRYFPPFITVVLIILSSLAISSMTTQGILTIDKSNVILRSQPQTNAAPTIELTQGEQVHVIKEQAGWVQVRSQENVEGWLPLWLLESESLNSDQNLAAYLNADTTIRAEASEQSNVQATAPKGAFLIVHYESKGWLQVSFDRQYGYIPTHQASLIHRDAIPAEDTTSIPSGLDDLTEENRSKLDRTIIVRVENEAFLEEANLTSPVIYNPTLNQRFEWLDTITTPDNSEFYLVEDENGVRGYLESRITMIGSDSLDHIGATNPGSLANATIMIDAGHGGEDSGAISSDGVTFEKTVALKTAQLLQTELEALGATVIQTRTNDSFVDLPERTTLSNDSQPDAFISLHYDALAAADWHGTTSYYFHEADYDLAASVNSELSRLELQNNGIHFGNYHVLRENNYPSILLELGYMTSPEDLKYIRSDAYLQQAAQAIAEGLSGYFNP